MGEICKPEEKKHSIATPEHEKILNIIDQIRAQGVSRYIDLPQIVVCGDQSVRNLLIAKFVTDMVTVWKKLMPRRTLWFEISNWRWSLYSLRNRIHSSSHGRE